MELAFKTFLTAKHKIKKFVKTVKRDLL